MSRAAPLRFLGLVLGGWIAARAAILVPAWWPTEYLRPAPTKTEVGPAAMTPPQSFFVRHPPPRHQGPVQRPSTSLGTREAPQMRAPPASTSRELTLVQALERATAQAIPVTRQQSAPLLPAAGVVIPSRWSVSAWALVRRGEGRQLAPGGTLGGSQAGMRITFRLREQLFLSGRVYAPLGEPGGAEAAFGVEWQPLRSAPVRLLAERRQAIGREGRSAFALLAHGGVSEQPVIGPVRADAYAQAGLVGLESRDAFVDGAVRLSVAVAEDVTIGVGAWGAAQPGASRLDVGPHASYRLPAFSERVRVSAEWRLRAAGDARPGSGPALTLSTDF